MNGDEVSYLGASGTALGYNLFAYCKNDSVNRCDSMGYYEGALALSGSLIASMSGVLSSVMASVSSSVAGIKTAIAISWFIPACVVAVTVAVVGIVYLVNQVNNLMCYAKQIIKAVKKQIKNKSINKKRLENYTVYVITRKNTTDVVYVGITKNYSARENKHTGNGKRFPKNQYKMLPIATNLSKSEARVMEQTIITAYTLDTLVNVINSISPKKWNNFKREFEQVTTLMQSWVDPE